MKLAFLLVLAVFLVLPLADASVGLGVSDYDTKVIVNRPISFAVGKVTNTGNETLVFSCVWKQTNSTVIMTLPVTSEYVNYTVVGGQSFEPTVTVGQYNESFAGKYSGVVEIKGSYVVQGGGDMVVPGAECHVTLMVNDLPGQQKQDTLPFIVFIGCILGIAVTLGIYTEWKRLKVRRKL
jgi:hypothetical protein